jgi:hypothetical protein
MTFVYSNVLINCARRGARCACADREVVSRTRRNRPSDRRLQPGVWGGSTSRRDLTSTEATVNRIILTTSLLVALVLTLGEAEATGLVNTEAGTFRCHGSIVRLDPQGVPSSGEPGGRMKRCDLVVEVRDTI